MTGMLVGSGGSDVRIPSVPNCQCIWLILGKYSCSRIRMFWSRGKEILFTRVKLLLQCQWEKQAQSMILSPLSSCRSRVQWDAAMLSEGCLQYMYAARRYEAVDAMRWFCSAAETSWIKSGHAGSDSVRVMGEDGCFGLRKREYADLLSLSLIPRTVCSNTEPSHCFQSLIIHNSIRTPKAACGATVLQCLMSPVWQACWGLLTPTLSYHIPCGNLLAANVRN